MALEKGNATVTGIVPLTGQDKTDIKTELEISTSDVIGLSTVASTGDYGDLSNKPNLFDALENDSVSGLQVIDPTIIQSYFWILSGNTDIEIITTSLEDNTTYVFSIEITPTTGTEVITFINPETVIYGEYDRDLINKLTFEVTQLPVAGLKINVFINQPT